MVRDVQEQDFFFGRWGFYAHLASIADGDVVTEFTPGFPGAITGFYFITGTTAVTTGSKASTLNLEIGTANLSGGSLALTSTGCNTIGKITQATAITGANHFSRTDTISIEAASTTAFSEGNGLIVVEYKGKVMRSEARDFARTMYPNRFHSTICLPLLLVDIASAADVVTDFTPGFVGHFTKMYWVTADPVTTGSKAATLNLEIGSTNVTGGSLALASSTATPYGKVIAASAITGNNRFDKDDTVSVEASSVTQFSEGNGTLVIEMEGEVL